MNFNIENTLLYSDTLVPDIFISEYLPNIDGDSVRVYIYCLFCGKSNKPFTISDLANKLKVSNDIIINALNILQSAGLIVQSENSVTFNDLKERTVLATYRLKHSSDPDKCISSKNKKRNKVIRSINNEFFQGVMSPSWYTDIDSWFEMFHFEDATMYMLFKHCFDKGVIQRNYILKVAQIWHSKGITTALDVENYFEECQLLKNIGYKIMKKLNRKTPLTSYENNMLEKWVLDYKYDFDIIDIALQKTTGTFNPSFNYINSIMESWYKANLKTRDEIVNYNKTSKEKYNKYKNKDFNNKSNYKNFEQRNYDESYFNSFYHNSTTAK